MFRENFLLVFAISLIAGLLLVACGTQSATEAPASVPEPSEPQEAPTEAVAPEPTEVPVEAPTEAPAEAPTEAVSFANDVFPILDSRCFNCHGGDRISEGLRVGTYEELMAGSENGAVVVPGDPSSSLLVELITNQKMPKRGPKLTPPQVQIISDWVAAGAPNN
jgi:hypothetical protein